MGIEFWAVNNWTYNVMFFANILVASWYFWVITNNSKARFIIKCCCMFNALLFLYVNLIEGKYNVYNNYVYAVSFITMVLYSLLYLYRLLVDMKEESLLSKFDFWLICGFLIYFLGAFIIVLYYDNAVYAGQRGNMWQMHNIILFICSAVTLAASIQIYIKNSPRNV